MTSPSKSRMLWLGLLGALAAVLVGCKDDLGTANTEKVNVEEAKSKQTGQGGVKAQQGGGLVDEPMAAPAGVKTGMPGAGAKTN